MKTISILLPALLLSFALLFSCSEKRDVKKYVHIPPSMPDSVYHKLKDGDIILRKGAGPLSFQIMNSTKEEYSHCGIIVNENDTWRVIHSMGGSVSNDNDDGMQIMDLKDFVLQAADSMLYICRATFQDSLSEKITESAYNFLAEDAPFDHRFNLFTRDRIYCSELLFYVLRDATGENQMKIRKQHRSYVLLFETFFDSSKYEPIFHLKDLNPNN